MRHERRVRIRIARGTRSRRGSRRLIEPGSLRARATRRKPGRVFGGRKGGHTPKTDGGRGSGCALDAGGYCLGYCTHYVWTRRPDLVRLGDAGEWLPKARGRGVPTGNKPVKGAAAWWRPGPRTSRWGHIAYVEKVLRGSIVVSEMNWQGWNIKSTRRIDLRSASAPDGYIYGGPAGNGPKPPPAESPDDTDDTEPVGRTDIFAINRADSGSNSTAVHVLDGAKRFRSNLLSTGTWLHQTGEAWAFAAR